MRLMNDSMMTGKVGNFSFSGIRPEKLGSTEYTLFNLNVDVTGSVSYFSNELLNAVKEVIEACKKSPRAEFILMRYAQFNYDVNEIMGFVPVTTIDTSSLTTLRCTGATSLYDAIFTGAKATNEYAKVLSDQYFQVNAISATITDGDDNNSIHTMSEVKTEINKGVTDEVLESNMTILIGVNTQNVYMKDKLDQCRNEMALDQYVDIADANANTLAKMAKFISQSVSSQSQSLGTGGKSQILTF